MVEINVITIYFFLIEWKAFVEDPQFLNPKMSDARTISE